MSKILNGSWWILLIILVGCAPLNAPGATPAPTVSPMPSTLTSPLNTAGAWIRFQRTGGIAGLNDTWLIYRDGTIEHAAKMPGAKRQLTPDELDQLDAAVRAADFRSLEASYVPVNPCCDRFEYTITVLLDGEAITVRTVDDAPNEPRVLTNLVATLNSIVK